MWTQPLHHPALGDLSQNQMDIIAALKPSCRQQSAAAVPTVTRGRKAPVRANTPKSQCYYTPFESSAEAERSEEGWWSGSGFAYQNVLQQLFFCCLVLQALFWNWPTENLWACFLPYRLGLKRATIRNTVWKSPSSVHLLLAPVFISRKSFRFEAKSLVGEDRRRQKARGTTSDLRAGCVMRTIWIYCKEQTDPGGSVNSLPCEH